MSRQRYTPEQIIEALRARRGRQFLAAADLKCDSDTIKNYINRYPKIKAVVEQLRGERLDRAEDKLDAAFERDEAWAICFMLKCQGKHRGYSERHELTGADGRPIQTQSEVVETLVRTREEAAHLLPDLGRAGAVPGLNGEH